MLLLQGTRRYGQFFIGRLHFGWHLFDEIEEHVIEARIIKLKHGHWHVTLHGDTENIAGGVIMGTLILAAGTAIGGWWPGAALALALLAIGYVALMLGTRRDAARVRVVRVHAHRGGMSDTSLFEVVGAQLDALDGADLSPVEYEAEWWRIYEALDRPIGE